MIRVAISRSCAIELSLRRRGALGIQAFHQFSDGRDERRAGMRLQLSGGVDSPHRFRGVLVQPGAELRLELTYFVERKPVEQPFVDCHQQAPPDARLTAAQIAAA